ncbi:MAG: DNA-3-methyladenine glycosylase family protein [Candidatus Poseidoniaceae archaeon]
MQTGVPTWWGSAVRFLEKDDVIGHLVSQYKGESLVGQGDIFSTLVRSIVGQQISVLAADSIWGRLSEVVGPMTPENICKLSPEIIAKCGLTKPKSQYIFGIASQSENFLAKDWESMTDEEITKHFISFRGIGPWTSEMLLIFALMRPDIFSIGDLGLVKAVQALVPSALSKEDVHEVSLRWKPYRTAASWYLWRMLDPVPVAY